MGDERLAQLTQYMQIQRILKIAFDRRAEILAAIEVATDRDEACRKLEELLGPSDWEARAVLDIQLFRWTVTERERLARTITELQAELDASA